MTNPVNVQTANLKAFCERLYRYVATLQETGFYSSAPDDLKTVFEKQYRIIHEYFQDSDTLDISPQYHPELNDNKKSGVVFSQFGYVDITRFESVLSLHGFVHGPPIDLNWLNLEDWSMKRASIAMCKLRIKDSVDMSSLPIMYCILSMTMFYIFDLMRLYHSKVDKIERFRMHSQSQTIESILAIITDLTMLLLANDNTHDEWALVNQYVIRKEKLIDPGIYEDRILVEMDHLFDPLAQSNYGDLMGGKNKYSTGSASYKPAEFEVFYKMGLIMGVNWAKAFSKYRRFSTIKTYLPIVEDGLKTLLRQIGVYAEDYRTLGSLRYCPYGYTTFKVAAYSKKKERTCYKWINMGIQFASYDRNSSQKYYSYLVFRYNRVKNVQTWKMGDVMAMLMLEVQPDNNGSFYFKPIAFNSNFDFKGFHMLEDDGELVDHVEAFQKFVLWVLSQFGTHEPSQLDSIMANVAPLHHYISNYNFNIFWGGEIFDSPNPRRFSEEMIVKWHHMNVKNSDFTDRYMQVSKIDLQEIDEYVNWNIYPDVERERQGE